MDRPTTHLERCETPDEPATCGPCGGAGSDPASSLHDARTFLTTSCETCEGAGVVCPVDGGVLMIGTDPVSGGTYPSCVDCDWIGHP